MEIDTRLGVIDAGHARIKSSVWLWNGRPARTWSKTVEVGNAIISSNVNEVRARLDELVLETRSRADLLVVYGGSLFRRGEWRTSLRKNIAKHADAAFALTTQEEGQLLMAAAGAAKDTCVIDIGGGSVQLCWKGAPDGTATVRSWPLGTFAIEERFGLVQGSPMEQYALIANTMDAEVEIDPSVECGRMLVGSNIMGSFFLALRAHLGLDSDGAWDLYDLNRAWRYCAQLPSSEFEAAFPQNPRFMAGADKALLVAWIFARKVGAEAVNGTNASVAEGVARLSFDAIGERHPLTSLGLTRL